MLSTFIGSIVSLEKQGKGSEKLSPYSVNISNDTFFYAILLKITIML